MSDVDYAAAAVTALERLNAVYSGGSTDGWEEKETNDSGDTLWARTMGDDDYVDYDAPADVIFNTFWDDDHALDTNSNLRESEVLEAGDDWKVVYRGYKAPKVIFRKRDVVFVKGKAIDDDGTIHYASMSVEHADKPPTTGARHYIRMDSYLSGCVITPTGDNSCTMKYYSKTDYGGRIPRWLVNWGIGAFLDRAEAIRALVNDDETSAIYRTASK